MKRFAFALGVTSCLVDVDLVYAKDSTLEERRLIPLTLTGGARKGGVFPTPLETKDFSRLILTRPQLKQNLLSAKHSYTSDVKFHTAGSRQARVFNAYETPRTSLANSAINANATVSLS